MIALQTQRTAALFSFLDIFKLLIPDLTATVKGVADFGRGLDFVFTSPTMQV